MREYFDLAAKRNEEIRKNAFVLPAAKAIGKMIKKNPGKSLGGAATAGFGAMDAQRFTKKIRQASQLGDMKANPAKTFKVGPTM